MKKALLVMVLVITASGLAMAADDMPPTLFQSSGMDKVKKEKKSTPAKIVAKASAPTLSESTPVVSTALPCPPADACNVCAAPVTVAACSATPACSTVQEYTVKEVPVRRVVEEMKIVPVKKRVVEEETYIVHEKRTASYPETRTRTAKRIIEVPTTEMVTEVLIAEVKPDYGSAIRLARGVDRKVVVKNKKEVEKYEESYITRVKYNYSVPVAKTRKVSKTVEELKVVPIRRIIREMEMRLVEK